MHSDFSWVHVYARSLYNNICNLTDYLKVLNFKFSVITIFETWANDNNNSHPLLPGYNSLFKNRVNDRGGGVALFIDSNLSFKERPDLNMAANENF